MPQTDDLGRIRAVVDAVGSGATGTEEIAHHVRISLRHAAYAIRAAVTLELVERTGGRLATTARGAALARTVPGSAEEATRLREAVTECAVVTAVAPNLLGRRGPSRPVLAKRIGKLASMAAATADRRAQTLLSWRRQLRGDRRTARGAATAAASVTGVPASIEAMLWDSNPWWRGAREADVPSVRRGAYAELRARLATSLAPAVLLRGPRQVGKTTLLRQLIDDELASGAEPRRIFRLGLADLPEVRKLRSPVLSIVRWYADRILGRSLHDAARDGRRALVVVDHAHEHPDWAAELRHLVDTSPIQLILAGDGNLEVPTSTHGLAGRASTLDLSLLGLPDVAALRGLGRLDPWLASGSVDDLTDARGWRELRAHGRNFAGVRDRAYGAFLARGGYPMAHKLGAQPWSLVAAELRESVIARALLHDSVVGAAGERLDRIVLERLWSLACRHAGGTLSHVLASAEQTDESIRAIGGRKSRAAFEALAATLLVRLVPVEAATAEARRAGATVCVCDHALADAWLRRRATLGRVNEPRDADPWAHRPDRSLVGYYLSSLPGVELAAPAAGPDGSEGDFSFRIGEHTGAVLVAPSAEAVSDATARAQRILDERRSAASFAVVVAVPSVRLAQGDGESPVPAGDGRFVQADGGASRTVQDEAYGGTSEPARADSPSDVSLEIEPLDETAERAADERVVVLPLTSLLLLR